MVKSSNMAKSEHDLGGPLVYRVSTRDGVTTITLSGRINEATDFRPLARNKGRLVFDLAEIQRINSVGVRRWMDFVRDCEAAGAEVTFERCSSMMVQQMSMITNFMGARSRVKSVVVPYFCPSCNHEHDELLEITPDVIVTPVKPCPNCKAEMRLEELAETYSEALQHA
jgi:anti-anti-sigma regulatory factor